MIYYCCAWGCTKIKACTTMKLILSSIYHKTNLKNNIYKTKRFLSITDKNVRMTV